MLFEKLVWFNIDVDVFCWCPPEGSGEVSTMTLRYPFMVLIPEKIDFFWICEVLFTRIVERSGVQGDD